MHHRQETTTQKHHLSFLPILRGVKRVTKLKASKTSKPTLKNLVNWTASQTMMLILTTNWSQPSKLTNHLQQRGHWNVGWWNCIKYDAALMWCARYHQWHRLHDIIRKETTHAPARNTSLTTTTEDSQFLNILTSQETQNDQCLRL